MWQQCEYGHWAVCQAAASRIAYCAKRSTVPAILRFRWRADVGSEHFFATSYDFSPCSVCCICSRKNSIRLVITKHDSSPDGTRGLHYNYSGVYESLLTRRGTKLQLLINKGGSVSGRFGLEMRLTNVAFVCLYIGLNDWVTKIH